VVPKELVAASSKPIVLSILAKAESYGYEIIQKVRLLSGERLQWTDGMLYPVLHRLEEEGLIRSRWGRSDLGRRRRYYHITAAGERALARELEHWSTVDATLSNLREVLACLSC
jgi:PadR family transcriptional regulator, regulatory protein PadR